MDLQKSDQVVTLRPKGPPSSGHVNLQWMKLSGTTYLLGGGTDGVLRLWRRKHTKTFLLEWKFCRKITWSSFIVSPHCNDGTIVYGGDRRGNLIALNVEKCHVPPFRREKQPTVEYEYALFPQIKGTPFALFFTKDFLKLF